MKGPGRERNQKVVFEHIAHPATTSSIGSSSAPPCTTAAPEPVNGSIGSAEVYLVLGVEHSDDVAGVAEWRRVEGAFGLFFPNAVIDDGDEFE
jgi:hypothetical protein